MKNCQSILIITATLLMTLNLMLPAAPPPKPGYLTRGTPFGLRKADRTRPPVYSLPPLEITPDPQPLPLTSSNPAQPLTPAGAAIPAMKPFKVEAKTYFLPTPAMVSPFAQPHAAGMNPAMGAFVNPQFLRYFDIDANGTYQSRILLNGSSLYTHPTMNSLLPRGSSATYQIK